MMKNKRWIGLAAVLAMAFSVNAQFTISYESATANTDVSGGTTLIYGIDGSGNLTGNSLANSAETLTGNSPFLTGVASFMTVNGYNLNGAASAIVADSDATDFLEANVSGSGWDTSGLTDIGFRMKTGNGAGITPGTGNNTWPSSSELMIIELTCPAGVGSMVFAYDGTSDNVYYLVGDADIADGRDESATQTLFPGETRTLLMWNRNAGGASKRIKTFSVDFTEAASNFEFTLTPSNQLVSQVFYPDTLATNDIIAQYVASASGVEVISVTPTGPSNEFSLVSASSFTMTDPAPSNSAIEIAFDASIAGPIGPTVEGWNTTGSVEVVYTEIGSGVTNIENVVLIGQFRNPPVKFNFDSSLSMSFEYPAEAVTNDITVSYIPGRPGQTNVEVIAVNILDASTNGFSAIGPGVIANPEPATDAVQVIFDNSADTLGHKQSATANVEIVWGEVGGTTNYTELVPVSVSYIEYPEGVIQQVFSNPAKIKGTSTGFEECNNYARFVTNNWIGGNISQSGNYIQSGSGGSNARCTLNVVQGGAAGPDNFGPEDTVVLSNGLYRYDFEYAVVNSDPTNQFGFSAYALIGQDAYDPSNLVNYVRHDTGIGTVDFIAPEPQGSALIRSHPNGTLISSNNTSRVAGSVYLNIQNGEDALFVINSAGDADVRLFELTLTRVGEFDPNTDTPNSPNAVLAADFNDASATNSIIQTSISDANSGSLSNNWRGTSVSWNGQALKSTSAAASYRAPAMVIRSGEAGYDDVGVQDTIALTSGVYDLTLDIEVTGGFPTNYSAVSVEVYSLAQDVSGNVNDVLLYHGSNTYVVTRGTATANLLGSYSISNNTSGFESIALTDMTVLDGQDVALVFYHAGQPDLRIDNVELVRTGDAALTGYDGWASGYPGFFDTALDSDPDGDDVINLLEYALNGDPTTGDASSVLPASFSDGDWLYYVHTERTDDGSLSYTVEINENLTVGTWTNNSEIVFVGESAVVDNYKTVTNRTDTAEAVEFIRLQVEKN